MNRMQQCCLSARRASFSNKGKSFCGLVEICPRVTVEYHEAGMGSLERVFDRGGIAEVQGGRCRAAGPAQDRETFRVTIEPNKTRENDFRTVVLHRGV